MTVAEKTNQTATLYGYGRVLKDEMPTSEWKKSIWKDGIANMDEALNSLPNNKKHKQNILFHTANTLPQLIRFRNGLLKKQD